MTELVPNVIGGEERPAANGATFEKLAPATGKVLSTVARSAAADVDAAIGAAVDAQPAWAARTVEERGRILRRIAQLLERDREQVAAVVSAETGKSPKDARGETDGAIELGYFIAGEGRRFYGKTMPSATPNRHAMTIRQPLGVAGLIIAANTPIANVAWKVFPALLCGNAAVLKASEDTPETPVLFARLAAEAGLPPGVLDIVQGLGAEAGQPLVEDPRVDLVSFTGSTAVGRMIARVAGERLAKVCLEQLQEGLEAEREEMREQLILEVGCPRMVTQGPQLDGPLADAIRYPAKLIGEFPWETEMPDGTDQMGRPSTRRVFKEPAGVVGAIIPWNFPFEVTINKVAQALATGNTMVVKPAPDTPWNATLLGRVIAEQTDIPPGVINIVPSSDHMLGEQLVESPLVDLVSFTGSTAVGQRIMEKGAATMKRVFLELGGKSATIVLDDADFASDLLIGLAVCFHAGQGCAIPTRMLLPRSRYDEGVELVKAGFETFAYGDPTDVGNMAGPLINARQRERVLSYIEKGKAEGARCLVGGGPATQFERGYFVQPTLFVDVDPSSTIAQEEIFGPVLSVIPYEDDDDAVRIANNSRYGLSGSVNSASLDRALSVARRIRTGTMSVNGGQWFGPDSPFGGYKESGLGREHGVQGFEEYLETKTIGLPA
jgi:aldehyde dehydrogenase (NAD+)